MTKRRSIPSYDDPAHLERRVRARQQQQGDEPISRRVTDEGYIATVEHAFELRKAGFVEDSDAVLAELDEEMKKNPVGRPPGPMEKDNRTKAPEWRDAWLVTIWILDEWAKDKLGKAGKGELQTRIDKYFGKAIADPDLKLKLGSVPDKEDVIARLGARSSEKEKWRQRFKAESDAAAAASASTQTTIIE